MHRKTRAYTFYDTATSVCSTCLARCEAKILLQDDKVFMEKWCRQHGKERVLISDDAAYWRWSREVFLKPSEMPHQFQTPMKWGCPYDCGLCPDHQQHSCLSILDITDRCNLDCPICYADSGTHRTTMKSLAEVEHMLKTLVASEHRPDIVQVSGGEPTVHPQLFEILDLCFSHPIRHVMLNTNGVRLAKDPAFAERLAAYGKHFEIYLQFDSLRDEVHQRLRGVPLAQVRQKALENCEAAGLSVTLVVTLEKGLNDGEIGEIIEHGLTWTCVRGVNLQPIQEAGRVEGYDPAVHRLTLSEVRRRIAEQSAHFTLDDLLPVPCHPDGLVIGYALKLNGQVAPLTRYATPEQLLAGPKSTILMDEVPELRNAVFDAFSTGLTPDGQAAKLSELLCCLPRVEAPQLDRHNVFRVLIVQFHDARDFDLRSVKKSCIHFIQTDGTIIPFDTYNLFYRDGKRKRLEELRARVDQGVM